MAIRLATAAIDDPENPVILAVADGRPPNRTAPIGAHAEWKLSTRTISKQEKEKAKEASKEKKVLAAERKAKRDEEIRNSAASRTSNYFDEEKSNEVTTTFR